MKHLIATLGLTALCSAPAFAGDHSSPSGFNLETVPAAGPLVAVLSDGSRLLASGSFGAASLTRVAPDGSVALWATGFFSIDGVDQSPVSGEVIVGDALGSTPLWRLSDLNGDGDALDVGEKLPLGVPLPVLSNGLSPRPFDLAFAPDSDELFVIGSTDFTQSPVLPAIVAIANGSANVFYDQLGFSGTLAFRDGVLYAADVDSTSFVGRVFALRDDNGDGDALDVGEAWLYADGLSGANGLAFAQDGSLWISGGFSFSSFTGCVGRLLPDGNSDGMADGVQECLFDGFGFSTGLTLFEDDDGFLPGAEGEGELWVGDFGFAGNVVLRSAPLAATSVDGFVGPDSVVHVNVSGAPFADGLFVISLDTSGVTVPGLGDLCLGFGDSFLISPLAPLGPSGEVSFKLAFRELPSLVGLPLVIQGFAMQDGALGIGDGLLFTFGS